MSVFSMTSFGVIPIATQVSFPECDKLMSIPFLAAFNFVVITAQFVLLKLHASML